MFQPQKIYPQKNPATQKKGSHALNEFSWWIMASVIIPLFLPFAIYYIFSIFGKMERNIEQVTYSLFIVHGVYLFFALTLIFDLFNEYRHKSVKGIFHPIFYIFFAIILFIFSMLFICSLKCIPDKFTYSLSDNEMLVYVVCILALVFVVFMKVIIIRAKHKKPIEING